MSKPRKPKVRPCKLCGQKPAVVPDRERLKPYAEVCADCHAERLRGDVRGILAAWGGRA